MKITDAILCDFATVCEGLLHVLGGGITVISRDTYPSPLDLSLALLIEAELNDFSNANVINIDVIDGKTAERIGGAEVGWGKPDPPQKRHPDVPYTISLVLPLPFVLPAPSLYEINLGVNRETARTLKFGAFQAEPLANVTPRSMII
jgi:hypothetical protein